MNPGTERRLLSGLAGQIELAVDCPVTEVDAAETWVGTAIVAHPHPLFGGTLDNKVVQTMARAFVQRGWRVVRFNFRGVGQSGGVYDQGRGELSDFLHVVATEAPLGELAIAGFSFGAFVASHAASQLHPMRSVQSVVLVGAATSRFDVAPIPTDLHNRTLVLHGELDDTVPLTSVLDWARPQSLAVTVVPGGSHFFHGQLPLLKDCVLRHLHHQGTLQHPLRSP